MCRSDCDGATACRKDVGGPTINTCLLCLFRGKLGHDKDKKQTKKDINTEVKNRVTDLKPDEACFPPPTDP